MTQFEQIAEVQRAIFDAMSVVKNAPCLHSPTRSYSDVRAAVLEGLVDSWLVIRHAADEISEEAEGDK